MTTDEAGIGCPVVVEENQAKGFSQKGKGKRKGRYKEYNSGAEHVADFLGRRDSTECPFYTKIGACRHGTLCSRAHVKPEKSRTILIAHLFAETDVTYCISTDEDWDDEEYDRYQQTVEDLYEECFFELAKHGEIEDLILADNISEHMAGNVYVKYVHEESALRALEKLQTQYYDGRMVKAEYCPVADFRDARCRSFMESSCARGANCNFLHVRHVPRSLKRQCVVQMYADHPEYLKVREEEGRPLVYKVCSKIDWDNDEEARSEFSHRWWTEFYKRRNTDGAGKGPPIFATAALAPPPFAVPFGAPPFGAPLPAPPHVFSTPAPLPVVPSDQLTPISQKHMEAEEPVTHRATGSTCTLGFFDENSKEATEKKEKKKRKKEKKNRDEVEDSPKDEPIEPSPFDLHNSRSPHHVPVQPPVQPPDQWSTIPPQQHSPESPTKIISPQKGPVLFGHPPGAPLLVAAPPGPPPLILTPQGKGGKVYGGSNPVILKGKNGEPVTQGKNGMLYPLGRGDASVPMLQIDGLTTTNGAPVHHMTPPPYGPVRGVPTLPPPAAMFMGKGPY